MSKKNAAASRSSKSSAAKSQKSVAPRTAPAVSSPDTTNSSQEGTAAMTETATPETAPKTNPDGTVSVTFAKHRQNKAGGTLYRVVGYAASVRFPKSLFKDAANAPETVTVTVPAGVLAEPGKAGRAASPEAKAKLEQRAQKAQDRAAKAKARFEKQQAAAAKLLAKAGITPAAEQPAETAAEQPAEA